MGASAARAPNTNASYLLKRCRSLIQRALPAACAVLAAAAFWVARSTIAADAAEEHATQLCSRIRFPAIPSHILFAYGRTKLLRLFDPERELTSYAVSLLRDMDRFDRLSGRPALSVDVLLFSLFHLLTLHF